MARPSGSSPCVVMQGAAADCSAAPSPLSILMQQDQQPLEAAGMRSMEGAGRPSASAAAAVVQVREGTRRNCSPPKSSSSSSSSATERPPALARLPSVKQEVPQAVSSTSCTAAASASEAEGGSKAASEGRGVSTGAAVGSASLRALQLLLSDLLGVLAMLRPAGSSALPRGVAAAVSRARQAALEALRDGREASSWSSSCCCSCRDGSSTSPVASALAAAANTAAVVLEQRNPQFAFHQFTVLAAASLQELSPYVTHHLRELLQVLEQRRSLLHLLRSQERRERQGAAAAASPTAEGHTDNLRLLLQVLLAYCPAAMLDSVCDRLAAAYAQALLGETHTGHQKREAAPVAKDGLEEGVLANSIEHLLGAQELSATAEKGAEAAAKETAAAAEAAADAATEGSVPEGTAAAPEAEAAADAAAEPRSLARPPGDPVAVSVAALLGQRSFLRRLASSMNWGSVTGEAVATAGSPSWDFGRSASAEDSDVAAALRMACDSAACLFEAGEEGHLFDGEKISEDALVSRSLSPSTAAAAAVGGGGSSKEREQRAILLAASRLPRSVEASGRRASSSFSSGEKEREQRQQPQQQEQEETGLFAGGRQAAAEAETAKGEMGSGVEREAASFVPEAAGADQPEPSSSSSHLLRALGSLELPHFLLQQSSASRSASPPRGVRCSSSDGTVAEAAVAGGFSESEEYPRGGASEWSFLKSPSAGGAPGDPAGAPRSTAHLRPSEEVGGKRRTLLQALSEVPEDYGVFSAAQDKGARMSAAHVKTERITAAPAAAGAAAVAVPGPSSRSIDARYLSAEKKTEKCGSAGSRGEEDAATKKATLVSFLLSLLPDSGSYAAAAELPASGVPAAASGSGSLLDTGPSEDATAASKSLECTHALLSSLQDHLLRYGPDETAGDQQQQLESAGGASGRRSRLGGPPPGSRGVGSYGKAEVYGQHLSGVGKDSAVAGLPPKHELLPHEEAAAASGAGGRSSEADPSKARNRSQQHYSVGVRQSAGAACDVGADSDLGGSGCVSSSYMSDTLGAPEEELLGSPSGGLNAQLLYRSTISGVVYDKSGQKWTARWSEYGRQHKKTFATAKYGFLHAKKRAEACRLEASRLMREGQGRALAAAARLAQVGGALQSEAGAPGGASSALPSHPDTGSSGPLAAFSGLALSAEAALPQVKEPALEGEPLQQQPLPQQDSEQDSLQQDAQQLQQQQQREALKAVASESASQALLEAQLPACAGPPSKRRRHKLSSGES
ncbi:hypothetical protein Emag_001776 [Eimeria magna]